MRLSLDNLEAFVAAAEHGSFSAAGRALGKVQSAVSSAVANLEIDVGVSLFDRSGKYPRLTSEGEVLLREAQLILARCGDFVNRAGSFQERVDARIRIGIDEIIPATFLLRVFEQFHQTYPETELEILYGSLTDIENLVKDDRVDLGVLAPVRIPSNNLMSRLVSYMSFCLVVDSGHPLAALDAVTAADLNAYRQLLITSRGGEHEPEEAIFSHCPWKIESTVMIHNLVRQGVGYSYLPSYIVKQDMEAGTLVELQLRGQEPQRQFPVYLIWPRGKGYGRSLQWLMESLARIGEKAI